MHGCWRLPAAKWDYPSTCLTQDDLQGVLYQVLTAFP